MKTIIKASLLITVTSGIFFSCAWFMDAVEDDYPPRLAIEIQLVVDRAKVSLGLGR